MCGQKKPGSKIKLSVIVVTVGPIFGKLNIQGYNIMHIQYKGEKIHRATPFFYITLKSSLTPSLSDIQRNTDIVQKNETICGHQLEFMTFARCL